MKIYGQNSEISSKPTSLHWSFQMGWLGFGVALLRPSHPTDNHYYQRILNFIVKSCTSKLCASNSCV